MNLAISSPQALAPLARISELTRAFYSLEDALTQKMALQDSIRAFISNHLRSPFRDYSIESPSHVIDRKLRGHRLSKAIASVRKNPKDIENAYEYLWLIMQMSTIQARQFEPSFIKAREMMSTEWQSIDLRTISKVISGDHLPKFDRYNMIYQLHFSISEPSLVAYYPSLDHMRRGREVKLRFGKFLSNVKNEIGIDESKIKNYVDSYNAILQAQNNWRLHFIESDSPQDWLDAYQDESNVSSCMSDCDSVKYYAHPLSVLRLAVLRDDDDNVIARSIVREDKKEYVRIYPPSDSDSRGKWLSSLLHDQGYSWGNLNGCLIKTFEHDEGGYKAPYIDRGNNGSQKANLERIDNKLYFRIHENGDYYLHYTNGRDREDESDDVYCESCGDYHPEDETSYYDSIGLRICEGCENEYYIWAYDGDGDDRSVFHQDDVIYCQSDDEYYHQDSLDQYGIAQDENSCDYYFKNELIEVRSNVFYLREDVLEVIVPYRDLSRSLIIDQMYIHYLDARYLPCGDVVHQDQYNQMIDRLNSFTDKVQGVIYPYCEWFANDIKNVLNDANLLFDHYLSIKGFDLRPCVYSGKFYPRDAMTLTSFGLIANEYAILTDDLENDYMGFEFNPDLIKFKLNESEAIHG